MKPYRSILQLALAATAGTALAAPGAGTWADPRGDAEIRRTDTGNDGPIGPFAEPTDLLRLTVTGWDSPTPATNPYFGYVSSEADLMRIELAFAGVVAPPGPLNDAYRFGNSPAFGFVELDIDRDKNTGGELDGAALNRYLANVARFGTLPQGSINERVAKRGDDYDFNFNSDPQFERSGAEFAVTLCGCWEPTIVSQSGDMDDQFDAGESWIVQGRFFERVQAFADVSGFFGGSDFGLWDPQTNVRYTHIPFTDETIVELIIPLTMAGAAAMADEPEQPIDFDLENHTSVVEAIDDFIIGADWSVGVVDKLLSGWSGEDRAEYLEPTEWDATALFGLAYETLQSGAVFVWTDTGFGEMLGDVNGDGYADQFDSAEIDAAIASLDGGPKDKDDEDNGEVEIRDFGPNFSLFDVNGDGIIGECDSIALGRTADINGDGEVTYFDLALFLNLYNAGSLLADFNGDGVIDFFDPVGFLKAFFERCL